MPGKHKTDGPLLESKFARWMRDQLKAANALVLKLHGHSMQEPGWPDLYVVHARWTGHIELKIRGETIKPLQCERMLNLRQRGIPATWLQMKETGEIYFEGESLCPFVRYGASDRLGVAIISFLVDNREKMLEMEPKWRNNKPANERATKEKFKTE